MPSFSPITTLDTPGLIVHASESWYQDVVAGRFDFFEKLGVKAHAEAMATAVVQAGQPVSQQLLQDKSHVHILIGPARQSAPGSCTRIPAICAGSGISGR